MKAVLALDPGIKWKLFHKAQSELKFNYTLNTLLIWVNQMYLGKTHSEF